VHVSQLSDNFVKAAGEVVKPQQKVMVTVVEIDLPRKRVALSMKSNPPIGSAGAQAAADQPRLGPRAGGPAASHPPGGDPRPAPAAPRPPPSLQGDWFSAAIKKKH
jgi:uncharacterized protein